MIQTGLWTFLEAVGIILEAPYKPAKDSRHCSQQQNCDSRANASVALGRHAKNAEQGTDSFFSFLLSIGGDQMTVPAGERLCDWRREPSRMRRFILKNRVHQPLTLRQQCESMEASSRSSLRTLITAVPSLAQQSAKSGPLVVRFTQKEFSPSVMTGVRKRETLLW